MCIVSMIFDTYGRTVPTPAPWPNPNANPNAPWPAPADPMPMPPPWRPTPEQRLVIVQREWDAESLALLKAALELLKKLDAKLGLPDCEDPKKAAWLLEIEKKVARANYPVDRDEWGRVRTIK